MRPSPTASLQGREVGLVLIGVRVGEVGDRLAESAAAPEIAGDRDPIARAGVGAREDRAADLGVCGHPCRRHHLHHGRALLIPELAHVEVPFLAIGALRRQPAEENVARGLSQPLALDDALTLLGELRRRRVRLEHRRLRFLDLKEEGVILVAADQKRYPRPGPDAADANYLARNVDQPVAVEQVPAVRLERFPVCVREDCVDLPRRP